MANLNRILVFLLGFSESISVIFRNPEFLTPQESDADKSLAHACAPPPPTWACVDLTEGTKSLGTYMSLVRLKSGLWNR